MTYNFEISIEASSEQEAQGKLQACAKLMQKLKVNELNKLAHVVQHDPVKTAFAKKALGL